MSDLSEHPAAVANRLVSTAERIRYRIDLQYDGTDFSGMQWQPDRRTVQQSVEEALKPLFGSSIRLIPSSRTDAGVHAELQVAHFDAPLRRQPHSIVRAGNVELPPDVRILRAEEKDASFHARFSARWRGYEYRISLEPLAIGRQYAWTYFPQVDFEKLTALAEQVVDTHNFDAFSHENLRERHNYQCTVYSSKWEWKGNNLLYKIQSSRFVHGMVRLLVGTMIDIASGHGNAKSITEILATRDNRFAGTKAPACGLTLKAVGYATWPELESR